MKKAITVLLLFAIICSILSACQTHGKDPVHDDTTPSTESADKDVTTPSTESTDKDATTPSTESTDKDATTQSNPTEVTEPAVTEPAPPPIPVDIETIGGVVIVGKIGFDEKGWHIIPEQPLNITYTYFLNKPSVFPAQTRISMMDPKDDGVDKAVYLGQTVTVSGAFRFVRNDFETIYLLPYTITIGKIAEGSYGDSNLKAPEGPVDLYDRSKPLPKQMEARIVDGKYIYNPFMLSEESLQLMGNDFALFYCNFVDAILNYKSEVPCPDKTYAEMLGTVIYYDFPIFNACAKPFEFFKHYNSETKTINIAYLYNAAAHQELLDRFIKAANEMLATVTPEMTDVEKAKNIYHQICTRMVYDNSALEDFRKKECHFAYLNNSGVCVTFANVYNQLLTQVGIKTTIATCEYDATMGHVWSVVTLDGKDYFCDPTFELSYDRGNGYIYFGMNYADRTKDGLGKDGIRVGRYFTSTALPEMIAAQSLKK